MHRAEDRLANKEIDDGTRQAQDDALKDLDQLIDLNENPPSQDDQKNSSSDSSKSGSSKSDPSKSASGAGSSGHSGSSGSSGRKSKGRGRGKKSPSHGNGSAQNSGSQPGTASGDKQQSGGKPDQKPGDQNGKSANGGGGGGGKDSPTLKDRNADLYKDVWGHLPETLRAEMNAYSNTKGFMPEYEVLISKYYRTIAEQGRRQGD